MTEIVSKIELLLTEGRRLARPHRVSMPSASARRRWLREPFLHFLLLGGALFFVSDYLAERGRFTRIVVTQDQIRAMAENYHSQYGRYPTAAQLESLVDGFTREEVFYHEAQRLGLDQDDEIVRRRLVQKYEFLQQDLAIGLNPTDNDLRTYFQQHEDRYRIAQSATFTQVFFSLDRRGDNNARAAAESVAGKLNSTGATRAPAEGDPFPGPADFPGLSAEEAERVFGKGELTAALFHLTPGHWSAPLRSAYGWHIIRVEAYVSPHPAGFDSVKEQVRRDYLDEARVARNDASYAQLKRNFKIVRE